METIRVFEAFAGYGSQSIALKLVAKMFPGFKFESVGISEIDKYAIKAYRALHGEAIPNLGDITKINWEGYDADIDLFTYSFPCQDISSAGKQRGFSEGSGTRSSCLWACADAIEAKHPKFLLMENVKALAVQKKFADDFAKWRMWLREQGYTNYYAVLNSKDYGVPQNRERVFMVSFLGSHAPFYFPAPFTLERRLKHILEDEVEEKYWLKPANIRRILRHNERKQSEGCGFKTNFQTGEGISGAIKTKEGSREYDTYIKVPTYNNSRLNEMIADGKIDPEETMWIDCYNQRVDPDIKGTILVRINASGNFFVSDPRVIQVRNFVGESNYKNPHRGRVYSFEGISPCLNCNEGGQREVKILQVGRGYNKGNVHDIAPALTSSKWQDNNFAVNEYWIRKLTPRECFRLMDVPEDMINILTSAGISNSQLYKLAGNSIVVAVLVHIFVRMFIETGFLPGAPKSLGREESQICQQLSLAMI